MNTKTRPNLQKKIAITSELRSKVSKAKGMIMTNYTGLTHQQLETLKRAVRKLDGEYVITKNTLLKRAVEDLPIKTTDDQLYNKPTATLFAYADIIEPLKVIAKSAKDISMPVIKAGYMDGQWFTETDVLRLSTLPAKPVLQAQLLGMMQQPVSGLHRALRWNLQKLVMTLHAVEQKK